MLNTGPHSCIWGGGLQLSSAGTGHRFLEPDEFRSQICMTQTHVPETGDGKMESIFSAGSVACAIIGIKVAVCYLGHVENMIDRLIN